MHKTYCIIGGGHGLSTLLTAMKEFPNLRIIIDVTDSGGSTGTLRKAFDCPAMGDMRRCLSELGDEQLRAVAETRIRKYGDCVGNLIISSLAKLYSFEEAIKLYHSLLGVPETQRVMPVSLENSNLYGLYENGKEVHSEDAFTLVEKIKDVWLHPVIKPNPEAIDAIEESDIVIIAPGSFFTSILTNFLVPGIAEATNQGKKKKIIWIVNLMQSKGETIGMDLNDHYTFLSKYVVPNIVLVNSEKPDPKIISKFYEGYLMPLTQFHSSGIKVIYDNYLEYDEECGIKHNAEKIVATIRSIR